MSLLQELDAPQLPAPFVGHFMPFTEAPDAHVVFAGTVQAPSVRSEMKRASVCVSWRRASRLPIDRRWTLLVVARVLWTTASAATCLRAEQLLPRHDVDTQQSPWKLPARIQEPWANSRNLVIDAYATQSCAAARGAGRDIQGPLWGLSECGDKCQCRMKELILCSASKEPKEEWNGVQFD